jgi:DNA-directed RNA polymerase specialized sigma24 family protein
MYAIDGYKSKEIAEILKINESSVRVEIHRSKLKLKDLLTQIEQNRKR